MKGIHPTSPEAPCRLAHPSKFPVALSHSGSFVKFSRELWPFRDPHSCGCHHSLCAFWPIDLRSSVFPADIGCFGYLTGCPVPSGPFVFPSSPFLTSQSSFPQITHSFLSLPIHQPQFYCIKPSTPLLSNHPQPSQWPLSVSLLSAWLPPWPALPCAPLPPSALPVRD